MGRDLALLILRLPGLGLAFAHGWAKVVLLSTGQGGPFVAAVAALGFPAPVLFALAAALAEFLGGLCVGLGLASRAAACFAAFTMGVAAFAQHHALSRLMVNLGLVQATPEALKAWGNPELALVYLAVFLTVAIAGPGRFALDSLRAGKR